MESILDSGFLKDLKKNLEKSIIFGSVAGAASAKSSSAKIKIKNNTQISLHFTKKSIQNVANDLDGSLKGQFGKKVTETIKQESQQIGNF